MAVNFDHQQDRITTQSGSLSINTSGSIKIPVGNTAQRPGTVATGQIRFNTQLSRFEGYNGSAWTGLGAVADADQDTFIETDKTADDDALRFYTVGTERVTIDNTGKLTVNGDAEITGNLTLGGNITLGDADTDNININAEINNNLIPNTDNTFDLGTSTGPKRWRNLVLSGTFDNSGSTGAMILAQGTDAQRPGSALTGMLRFSTTSNKAEVYDGSAWVEVGTTPPVTEAFKNVAVNGQSDVVADTATDTLTLVGSTGITVTTDAATDTLTFTNDVTTLGTLTDTSISSTNAGQHLQWNGANWINTYDFNSSATSFLSGFRTNRYIEYRNSLITIGSISSGDTVDFPTTTGTGAAIEWQVNNPGTDFVANINPGPTNINTSTYFRIIIDNTSGATKGSISGIKRNGTTQTVNWINGSLPAVTGASIYDVYQIYCFRGNGGSDETWYAELLTAASGGLTVQDEGVALPTDATTLNFVGGAVNVTGSGATKTITMTSGGSSADEIDDADGDTNIKVETNVDEDIIRFTTAGSERANISATGALTIGDSAGATFYTFPTARGTANQILKTDANGVLTFQDLTSGSGGASYQNNAPSAGLATGDLWFDTGTSAELYIYSGSEWISTAPGADTGFIKYYAVGDNTTTAFNTGAGSGTVSMVFVDGDLKREGATEDYIESNGTITFSSAPALNAEIDVMITGSLVTLALNPLGLANHNLITVDSSGNTVIPSLKVSDLTDNRIVIAGSSGEIEDDVNFTFDGADLKITTTSSIQIPAGTTPQRPTGSTGKIRFNTQTNQFEGYNGSAWGDLGAGALAIAGDTGTDNTVVIGTDTLTFAGGTNIATTVTNNQVEIAMSLSANSINDTHIDFGTGANQVNTDDLPEGSNNKYFTTSGATIDTDALPQGSTNLYYSDAQVQAVSINEVVEDTTPQLGGDLDVNGKDIVSVSNGDIELKPNGAGIVSISSDLKMIDMVTGSGQAGGVGPDIQFIGPAGNDSAKNYISLKQNINDNTVNNFETATLDIDVLYVNTMKTYSLQGGWMEFPHNILRMKSGATYKTDLSFTTPTANRTITVPDSTGTIALTSDIPSLSGYLQDVVDDTTPQLGGNLDVNGNDIVSASSADIKIMPDGTGKVGIGESSPAEMLHVNGNIRIDGVSTIATATATLSSTTETAIDTFAKATFRSCKYIVQATDTVSNEYQILEALLIHDGTTAYVTSYGIIHTGSADLFTVDADISGANARLKATSASTNQTVYKVTRITTLA